MSTKKYDLRTIQVALMKLINASLEEDKEKIALTMFNYPELRSEQTDNLLRFLIHQATKQTDKRIVQMFRQLRKWLQIATQELSGAYNPPLNSNMIWRKFMNYWISITKIVN